MQGYNGWANYETWNVALWIQNSERLYHLAQQWAEHGYKSLSHQLVELRGPETLDGVAWNDPAIDINELNEMLAEL
jgi:hypothetical protein